jgi:hypothetical protein
LGGIFAATDNIKLIRPLAYFVFGDYLACFYQGPFIGPMDPYPFRSAFPFLGGLLMVVICLLVWLGR